MNKPSLCIHGFIIAIIHKGLYNSSGIKDLIATFNLYDNCADICPKLTTDTEHKTMALYYANRYKKMWLDYGWCVDQHGQLIEKGNVDIFSTVE